MESISLIGKWLADSFLSLYQAIGTWGVIGFGIIALPVLYKISRIVRRLFNF